MIGEVTCGGSPHLSCKRVQNKMRDLDRRVTSPTWGPQPPCKQALSNHHDEKKKKPQQRCLHLTN